jgi:protein SCO1/2
MVICPRSFVGMRTPFAIKALTLFMGLIFFHSPLTAHVEQSKDLSGIGIDEKLGHLVPVDLTFNDEDGTPVALKQLIHTPIILTPVYLHCPNVCSLLLQNLADVLNRLPAEPDKEYRVISVSFDEKEKPDLARQKKESYLKMIQRPFPAEAWRFLTGDKENIRKLTDAIGFHFKRVGKDFEHPVAIIILGSEGKITRYLYGADPLPFDLKLALIEASQGRIGPTIAKVVRFCFSYDPRANKLVFNMLRVTGAITLLFALSFILFLILKGKKPPKEVQGE